MYKPLLLGISNANPVVLYGVLIFLFLSLISIAGIIVYFTGFYIIKLIRRIRRNSTKNRQPELDITKWHSLFYTPPVHAIMHWACFCISFIPRANDFLRRFGEDILLFIPYFYLQQGIRKLKLDRTRDRGKIFFYDHEERLTINKLSDSLVIFRTG